MTKRENDLSERTLRDKVDGVGDRQKGMGKLSQVTRAKPLKGRARFANEVVPKAEPQIDPTQMLKQSFLANLQTDLHARDKATGQRIPTLRDRVLREGYRAQLKAAKPSRAPAPKRRKKTKRKAAKKPAEAQS